MSNMQRTSASDLFFNQDHSNAAQTDEKGQHAGYCHRTLLDEAAEFLARLSDVAGSNMPAMTPEQVVDDFYTRL